MKKFKRFLCLLLTWSILLSVAVPMVQAEEPEKSTRHFIDVPDSAWFYSDVYYAYDQGLMNGMSADTFCPEDAFTRAMTVTVLGRLVGIATEDYPDSSFTDVEADSWYGPYVQWAAEAQITNGMTATTFLPEANVTREQMATFMHRFLSMQGIEAEGENISYADNASISSYAVDAVKVCYALGFMVGNDNYFRPQDSITRAEAATVFARLHRYLEENGGNTDVTEYVSVRFAYPDGMSEEDKAATMMPEEQIVTKGSLVYALPMPTREGYTFGGWYYDSDLAVLAMTEDILTENVTLYPLMVKAEDAVAQGVSLNYVASEEVEPSFAIKVKAPGAEAVRTGLSLTCVSQGNAAVDFTVTENGDGIYTVAPVGGFTEGMTYQFSANDREKGFTEDGQMPSDDEYVLFVYEGEVQPKAVRYYNIFTAKEEVSRMRIDDHVSLISLEDVSSFDIADAAGLYSVTVDADGNMAMKNNEASGTFVYDGNDIAVGDVIGIYEGTVDEESHTLGEDTQVAYIEIVAVQGNTYSYVSAQTEDVMFLPDVIPVSVEADTDSEENSITVDSKLFDFSFFENQEILNRETTVDADDYLALYEGALGETTEAQYAKITSVQKNGETTTVTYVPVTLEELKKAIDTYEVGAVDIALDEEEVARLENEIVKQAEQSGFAEKAAKTAVQNELGIDEEIVWGKEYEFTQLPRSMRGMKDYDPDIEAGSLVYMVRIDPVNISVDIDTKLQKVTQVSGGEGLRVAFGITIPVGIEVVENGIRVVESFYLDLYVTFEQEVAFKTRFSASVRWDNWAYIVWWIDEIEVNAGFDMGVYTGVGGVVAIYTEKYHDKSYIWNELIDGEGGSNFTTAESLSQKLNKMMEGGDYTFFGLDGESSLVDEYSRMLAKEIDYVDIFAVRLFHKKGYFDPKTKIVNYVLDLELVFAAKLNVTMGISFENLNVKSFNFYLQVFDRKSDFSQQDKQTPYTNFNFFIYGNLGLRAGLRVTLSVGLISVKLDHLSFMGEFGFYLDLYGYFYFHFDKVGNAAPKTYYGGALYIDVGCYLDIDFFGGVLMDLASFTIHLYEDEFSIHDSGDPYEVVGAGKDNGKSAQKVYNDKTFYLSESTMKLLEMNLVTGDTRTITGDINNFEVSLTNREKFSFDRKSGAFHVKAEEEDLELSTQIRLTYTGRSTSIGNPLTITVDVTWKKTEPMVPVYYYKPLVSYGSTGKGVPDDSKTLWYVAYSQLPALPDRTVSVQGYDFAGWQVDCPEMPEIHGKWLKDLNYLEGVTILTDTPIGLTPVMNPRSDTPYKVMHYLESVDRPGQYDLYLEENCIGTTTDIVSLEHYLYEDGIKADYSRLPIRYQFTLSDGTTYTGYGAYIYGDGSTVLNLYYLREDNSVQIHANNRDFVYYSDLNPSAYYTVKEGAPVPNPGYDSVSIPGYTFKGWSTTADGSGGILAELPQALTTDKTDKAEFYAIWESSPVEVTINHYVIGADKNYPETPTATQERTLMCGDTLTSKYLWPSDESVVEQAYVDYVEVFTASGEVYTKKFVDYAEGSKGLTVNVYYTRQYYCVYFAGNVDYYYRYQTVTIPDAPKEGYHFLGWKSYYMGDETLYTPGMTLEITKSYGFTPVYEPKTDTPYTVNHIRADQQGSYDSTYAEVETEVFYGTTDERVYPEVRSYKGFVSPSVSYVEIAPDGSSVKNYYYRRKTYNIDIDTDGGRLNGRYKSSYTYGVPFYLFVDEAFSATKTGYDFGGIYLQGDESKTLLDGNYWIDGDLVEMDQDLVFVILWKEKEIEYKVEHYLQQLDGSYKLQQTDTLTSAHNAEVSAQPASYTGFTYAPSAEGTVLSGTVVDGGETLVLKLYYTRNSYEARWYGYDGKTLLATTTVKYQAVITPPTNTADSRTGYTFAGWKADGYGTMSAQGASFNTRDFGLWTANTYTVVFDKNNDAVSGTMTPQTFTYDVSQSLSPVAFHAEGWSFDSWNTKADGTGTSYADQQEVMNLATQGSVTVYAQWIDGRSLPYTVEHYLENLDGSFSIATGRTQSFEAVVGKTVNATSVTIEGFTYDANNKNNIKSGTISAEESLVLKLYYSRNSYELTFDFNGESMKQMVEVDTGRVDDWGDPVMAWEVGNFEIEDVCISVKYGENLLEAAQKQILETYPGYTFGGWMIGETQCTVDMTMPAGELTLTAKWNPVEFKVIYYAGVDWANATADTDVMEYTYYYGDVIEAPDVNFTSESYTVCGWLLTNYEPYQGSFVSFSYWPLELVYGNYSDWFYEELFAETGEYVIYLTPFWSSNYTVVTFNGNGALGEMNDQILEYYAGGTMLQKNLFVREGYVFTGWNTAPDGSGTHYDDREYFYPVDNTGAHEVTLYAQWEKLP